MTYQMIATKNGNILYHNNDSHREIKYYYKNKYDLENIETIKIEISFSCWNKIEKLFEKNLSDWNLELYQDEYEEESGKEKIFPKWFTKEMEEKCYKIVKKNLDRHVFINTEFELLKNKKGIYVKDCKIKYANNCEILAYGITFIGEAHKSKIFLQDTSIATLYNSLAFLKNKSSAILHDSSSAKLCNESSANLYNSYADLIHTAKAYLYNNSRAKFYDKSSGDIFDDSFAEFHGRSHGNVFNNSFCIFFDKSVCFSYDDSIIALADNSEIYNHSKNNKIYDCRYKTRSAL